MGHSLAILLSVCFTIFYVASSENLSLDQLTMCQLCLLDIVLVL